MVSLEHVRHTTRYTRDNESWRESSYQATPRHPPRQLAYESRCGCWPRSQTPAPKIGENMCSLCCPVAWNASHLRRRERITCVSPFHAVAPGETVQPEFHSNPYEMVRAPRGIYAMSCIPFHNTRRFLPRPPVSSCPCITGLPQASAMMYRSPAPIQEPLPSEVGPFTCSTEQKWE